MPWQRTATRSTGRPSPHHTRRAAPGSVGARGDDGAVRLRDRGRRIGRIGARQPALDRPIQPGAGARGGTSRLQVGRLHPHAGGARLPDRQQALRLEVRDRARAVHERPPRVPRPRQGARRVVVDQRHDLPARQPDGLRTLGGRPWHGHVGLRPLPPVLQAHGELPRRRRRVPRRPRPARARARARREPALRRVLRSHATGRLPAHRRRQRLPPGRLRQVRPQHPPRPPVERGACLPPSRDEPTQPHGRDAGTRPPDPVRRHTGDGRRVLAARSHAPRRRRRGRALRWRLQLAATAAALGRRRRRPPAIARDRAGAPPAGGRRAHAGPPRGVHPARLHATGVDPAVDGDVEAPVHRASCGCSARAREPATTSKRAGSCARTTTSTTPT